MGTDVMSKLIKAILNTVTKIKQKVLRRSESSDLVKNKLDGAVYFGLKQMASYRKHLC